MRILILNADYPAFLRTFYRERPELGKASYATQMAWRNASLFGVADFYSWNLRAHGHEAAEVHVNNAWLQSAWAREHGQDVPIPASVRASHDESTLRWKDRAVELLKPYIRPLVRGLRGGAMTPTEQNIVAMQIEDFRPDVVLNQDMAYIPNGFLKRVCPCGSLVLGQLAAPVPADKNFDAYDFVISSLPVLVDWFRAQGVHAEINRLAFEPRVLEALGPPPNRDIDISFVGSLSPEHGSRIELLEYVARRVPLRVWGVGVERLPSSSPLIACYQGEAWGRDMYDILRRSRITLNHHIDLAGCWANNMRLYEATGVGALLLTDRKKNLGEIFVPGSQVADYETPEECVNQILRFLSDEPARLAIAEAGQRNATKVENYFNRMQEFLELVASFDSGKKSREMTG